MARRNPKIQKRYRVHALGIHPFCRWCHCPLTHDSATTDHLVPLSRGGNNDWENLCLACVDCNQKRQNRLPSETLPDRADSADCCGPIARPVQARIWVAWTRYPGGRWRPTFRGSRPETLLVQAQNLVGEAGETVILHESEEPTREHAAWKEPPPRLQQSSAPVEPHLNPRLP